MAIFSEIRKVLESYRRQLRACQQYIKQQQAKLTEISSLVGGGTTAFRGLCHPEVLVAVRISAVVDATTGQYMAVPIMLTSGSQEDDDDEATPFAVKAGFGSIPFVGCRTFVRYMGLVSDVPLWHTVGWGEDRGFRAKLTSAVDGSHTYQWTQVDNAPGTTALAYNTGSLGRAKDIASSAYDTNITSRVTLPTNTEVTLHWNYTAGQFQFHFGPEPQSEAC